METRFRRAFACIWRYPQISGYLPGPRISIINCDYLPDPAKSTFPPELALLIARKAA